MSHDIKSNSTEKGVIVAHSSTSGDSKEGKRKRRKLVDDCPKEAARVDLCLSNALADNVVDKGSVQDENDLDLCIKNSQEEQSSMNSGLDNRGKEKVERALWTTEVEHSLFEIMRTHARTENLRVDAFKERNWTVIRDLFNATTNSGLTTKQIIDKNKRWKLNWRTWKGIKNTTGVGWDSLNKTFVIEDWDAIEAKFKDAKSFKGRSLPLFDEFSELYVDNSADPSRGFSNRSIPQATGVDFVDCVDLGDDDVGTPTSGSQGSRKRQSTEDLSCTRKSKSRMGPDRDIASAMQNLSSSIDLERESRQERRRSVIQEAMKLFEEMRLPRDDLMLFWNFLKGPEARLNAEKFVELNEEGRHVIIDMLRKGLC